MAYKLKRMIRTKEPAVGLWLNFSSPDLVEFLGMLGFDFVVIDTEHYLFGADAIANIVRAANYVDCSPILRVRANDPSLMLSYLDVGVEGIIVPHVKTAREAQIAVSGVKFPPLGKRSTNSVTRGTHYALNQPARDAFQEMNRETLVITMVEDPEGIENLDEILAVEGLDTVFIGPEDLAASLGYMGQPGHPSVRSVIEQAESKILGSGKPLGRLGVSAEGAAHAFADGALFFALFFPAYLAGGLETFFEQARGHTRK